MADIEDRPWYRHLWPWLLMIPPAGAVFGGLTTAWMAGGPPAMVVDDYSEIALSTERDLARDRRAAELALVARLNIDAAPHGEAGAVRVTLASPAPDFRRPEALALRIVHPTRARFDRAVRLDAVGEAAYAGRVERPPGRLYFHVADPAGDWRLIGELGAGDQSLRLGAAEFPESGR